MHVLSARTTVPQGDKKDLDSSTRSSIGQCCLRAAVSIYKWSRSLPQPSLANIPVYECLCVPGNLADPCGTIDLTIDRIGRYGLKMRNGYSHLPLNVPNNAVQMYLTDTRVVVLSVPKSLQVLPDFRVNSRSARIVATGCLWIVG